MSRESAVESSCATQLATLAPTPFAETRVVAAGMLLATRPSVWPTALMAVIASKQIEFQALVGKTQIQWEVEVGVLILANSDGAQLGDARTSAWTLADSVVDAFLNFWPTGFAAGTNNIAPCKPGDRQPVLTDAGEAAIYVPLIFRIQTIK